MINDEQVWLDGYYHGLKEAYGLRPGIFGMKTKAEIDGGDTAINSLRRMIEWKMKEIKEEYDAKAR
jgi:hypothetical protein